MDLVIMAAGIGSRFGGLKQLEPIDENNNFIIDYSIFDAIRAGFNHIVFIIKKEHFEDFKNTIGNRIEKYVDVDYVFQDTSNIPSNYNIPETRIKPFGTGHAILCAKNYIRSDFAVINADDFYGKDAYKVAAEFLKINKNPSIYALITYQASNTLSENGSVKRGICECENGYLKNIIESSIEENNNKLIATALELQKVTEISKTTPVSMNLFAFSKDFLNYLDDLFLEFLNLNKNDLSCCEFFLPTAVAELINKQLVKVKILSTNSKWYGITYKPDLDIVKSAIKTMIINKDYPNNLWQ